MSSSISRDEEDLSGIRILMTLVTAITGTAFVSEYRDLLLRIDSIPFRQTCSFQLTQEQS